MSITSVTDHHLCTHLFIFFLVTFSLDIFAASCNVTLISGINLIYDPSERADQTNIGRIGVLCNKFSSSTENVAYTIQMSQGNGTFNERLLQEISGNIKYNLYKDASHTNIWGDNSAGYTGLSDAYQLSVPSTLKEYNVYLLAYPGQLVNAGMYTDTIMLTVEY